MRNGNVRPNARGYLALLLVFTILATATGCFGSRGFPSTGNIRVRVINESADPVSDVTVTHGRESSYAAEIGPGKRTSFRMAIQEDEDFIVRYFHPRVGTERREYGFRARETDAGYIEIRIGRLGLADVRSRFKLTEDR